MKIEQKIIGVIPNIVMLLMTNVVKKYHQNLMNNFKAFAESNR